MSKRSWLCTTNLNVLLINHIYKYISCNTSVLLVSMSVIFVY